MEIELRLEEEKDYPAVEELTREAFWNTFVPGCTEHLILHKLRKAREYIGALDFVAMCGGKLVGHIVYTESRVQAAAREYRTVTFGPISVLPEYQRKGIGSALIRHTTELSREMGYTAVIIYGDPAYYSRFGFRQSKEYQITNRDGRYPAALLVLELHPQALQNITGVFDEGELFTIKETELEEFEKGFPPKDKLIAPTQERFKELTQTYL